MTRPPGFLQISASDYHADLLGDDGHPSLSAGLASIIVNASPAHARAQHPRLNPDFKPREEARFDLGRVAHQVMLEGNANIVEVDAIDWRTKDAKTAREWARENRMTPLLTADWENVQAMVEAGRKQLAEFDIDPIPFTDGTPEQTIVWSEPNGVCCKARPDWIHTGNVAVSDYKTTSRSANPESWARSTLYTIGADVQVAFYSRGLERLTGVRPEWRYVVQETFPPFALSVISLGPDVLELGNAKLDRAIEIWARCLETNEWDGYPRRVCWAAAPAWEVTRWLEREAVEAAA
jgi:hypothetical protein